MNVLSLGAGVQSSVVLLMSCRGELPRLDAAIFADVGWEPKSVYEYLEFLKLESAKYSIPIHVVSRGNLRADALSKFGNLKDPDAIAKKTASGRRWASMPMFTLAKDGTIGMIRRQCTGEYKIAPVEKKLRELAGVKPRSRPKVILVNQYFGISAEEPQRMRDAKLRWVKNEYPLVDLRMTRQRCLEWLERNGYPPAPRSACIGCPFHSDAEWSNIKNDPEQWADAVEFDNAIRNCGGMRGQMFLHRSCKPLDEIDFRSDVERGQNVFGFETECTGMCGS